MEPTEIEKAVGDLEVAVDRLRSLYEQYFMGIEKLEPTVPRKDVDRRIHALRKDQIRNTALRFRFQMILQRYNVYQTHWQRICREIENGTYKRHLLKAERRFGEEGSAKRRRSAFPPPSAEVPRDLAKELADLDADFAPPAELDDLDMLLEKEEPAPVGVPRPGAAPAAPAAGASPVQRKPAVWRKVEPALPRQSLPAAAPSVAPPVAAPRPQPPTAPPRAPAPPATSARPPTAPPAQRPAIAAPVPASPAAPRAPAPAPAPPRPAIAAPPRPAPAGAGGEDLPEARVRQIYAQYVDAKRRSNESTAAITYEAVAKSLRDSSAKLREKHGKAVDFEVAVKDGKAILKPVIK